MEFLLRMSSPVRQERKEGRGAAANPSGGGYNPRATQSEFTIFAEVGESIADTAGKLEKVRLLADYLRTLSEEQLRIAAT